MKEIKIIISLLVLGVILSIIVVLVNYKQVNINNNSDKNNINYKYDINKIVEELNLKNIDDYIEYLNEVKQLVKPKALREMIIINKIKASVYMDSSTFKNENGNEISNRLKISAYATLLNKVVQKNQSWSDLPLTNHFRSKFNEKDGCIKEIDSDKIYVHNFGYSDDNKTFSIEYSYIPDDAYEKYLAEQIEFMLEYGAGAYNLDYYNYQYVLDDEGYLDDIIFLGITPHIVEGRYVDEDE